MPSVFSTLIYIGNFSEMDTNELDDLSDNGDLVAGTHTSISLQTLEFIDANSDGVNYDDDQTAPPAEAVIYDVGGGTETQLIDATHVHNGSFLLGDGSTFSTQVTVIQMQNGDVFVAEFVDNGSLDGKAIQSVTLNPSPETNYNGFYNFSDISGASVVCFVRNTRILTANGPVAIERLRPGDLVVTIDHGLRPVGWIGGQFHPVPGSNAPIRIAAGALGSGNPAQALLVSPQHRILIRNKVAERMFGQAEVLVASKTLLGLPGVEQTQPSQGLTYWHLAFETHEIVCANGAWAETLYPGPMAFLALCPNARNELKAAIPGFEINMPALSRLCPPKRRLAKLVDRLGKNRRAAFG